MGRAIDRLPVDFVEPRKPPRKHNALPDQAFQLVNDDDTRWAAMQAVTLVQQRDGLDNTAVLELVQTLGLDALRPRPEPVAPVEVRPVDIPCPRCGVQAGKACIGRNDAEVSYHVGRRRRAEALTEENGHG